MIIRENAIEVMFGIVGEVLLRKIRNGAMAKVAIARDARCQGEDDEWHNE